MATGFPTKANWAAGDVLTASAMDDLAGTVNLLSNASASTGQYLVSNAAGTSFVYNNNFAAGKNKVINGAFDIWQRGTSGFTFGGGFNADRFQMYSDGTGATRAISQQTFTPGTAPVSGYEGQYYFRYNQSVAGSGGTLNRFYTKLEDVRTFAGQTVTLSFWAKADAARTLTAAVSQNFGSGGSGSVATSFSGSASATTAWTRFSFTLAIPSISGKTVGTSSYLEVDIDFPLNVVETIDIWGVQVEAGSVATAFQTATGTLQGELAACQRYYYRVSTVAQPYLYAFSYNSSSIQFSYRLPVTMRTSPTTLDTSNINIQDISTGTSYTGSTISINSSTPDSVFCLQGGYGAALTTYRPYNVIGNGTLGYLGFGAEL